MGSFEPHKRRKTAPSHMNFVSPQGGRQANLSTVIQAFAEEMAGTESKHAALVRDTLRSGAVPAPPIN